MKNMLLEAVITLCLFATIAGASDYRQAIDGKDGKDGRGTALGIAASQFHPDWDYLGWQGSIGVGHFDGQNALSVGLARRLCPDCGRAMINGSVGVEDDEVGAGAGVNFRW